LPKARLLRRPVEITRQYLTFPITTASAAADIEGHSKAAKLSQQGRLNLKLDYFTRFSGCKTASANLSHSAGISR
jgi:hypothetical protein